MCALSCVCARNCSLSRAGASVNSVLSSSLGTAFFVVGQCRHWPWKRKGHDARAGGVARSQGSSKPSPWRVWWGLSLDTARWLSSCRPAVESRRGLPVLK